MVGRNQFTSVLVILSLLSGCSAIDVGPGGTETPETESDIQITEQTREILRDSDQVDEETDGNWVFEWGIIGPNRETAVAYIRANHTYKTTTENGAARVEAVGGSYYRVRIDLVEETVTAIERVNESEFQDRTTEIPD